MHAELILVNGRITTQSKDNPEVSAVAVKDGRFLAVGIRSGSHGFQGKLELESSISEAAGLFQA